jgi:hypothetical protein
MIAGEIDWSEYDQFLGKFSDKEVASIIGCSMQSVWARREALNIEPCFPSHSHSSSEIDYNLIRPRLGTMSDYQIAKWYHKKTGKKADRSSIRRYREALNIKAYGHGPKFKTAPVETQEEETMKSKVKPWEKTETEILDSMKNKPQSRKVSVEYYHRNIAKKMTLDVPDVASGDPKLTEAILVGIIKDMDIQWSYKETKLKKCPFCYGEDLETHKVLAREDGGRFAVHCKGCNSTGPFGNSEAEAMAHWGVEEVAS